jgi:hypothetical protein
MGGTGDCGPQVGNDTRMAHGGVEWYTLSENSGDTR